MTKKRIVIVLLLALCLFICSGCYQRVSPEVKAYMEQQLEDYERVAYEMANEALTEKYGDGIKIKELRIVENKDYTHGFGDEPYQTIGVGKAELNDKTFDYYVQWNMESSAGYICCDNLQKDEIIKDLDEYIYSLYGKTPYAKHYAIFPSLGYEFDRTDGMLQEKYTGDIEEFFEKFPKLVNIALAFTIEDEIPIEEHTKGENTLEMCKRVYIINSHENTLTENDLKYIVLRGNMEIEKVSSLINDYWYFKNGNISHTFINSES